MEVAHEVPTQDCLFGPAPVSLIHQLPRSRRTHGSVQTEVSPTFHDLRVVLEPLQALQAFELENFAQIAGDTPLHDALARGAPNQRAEEMRLVGTAGIVQGGECCQVSVALQAYWERALVDAPRAVLDHEAAFPTGVTHVSVVLLRGGVAAQKLIEVLRTSQCFRVRRVLALLAPLQEILAESALSVLDDLRQVTLAFWVS